MKFLGTPTDENLARSRPPVAAYLAFAAVAVLALAAQRHLDGELSVEGVVAHYTGTGDPLEVMPLAALLESLHMAAFVYGMEILVLGSLLVVSRLSRPVREGLAWALALACALDLAAPFAVVRWPGLAWIRVSTGVAALGSLLAVTLLLGALQLRPARARA